ncbi:DUF1761 domain-containing protein [Candidatus Gracilibacteria bacterium]|nr:DUF1761 domain-containing protein [Candidatus Gracilibacteria bacterium]
MTLLIHALAILAALAGSCVVGFVWYGPLFGKRWMAYTGIKESNKKAKANMKKYMFQNMLFSFISILVLASVISFGNFTELFQVIFIIILSWIMFTVPAVMAPNIWEQKSFGLGMINIFASLCSFLVSGVILFLFLG